MEKKMLDYSVPLSDCTVVSFISRLAYLNQKCPFAWVNEQNGLDKCTFAQKSACTRVRKNKRRVDAGWKSGLTFGTADSQTLVKTLSMTVF